MLAKTNLVSSREAASLLHIKLTSLYKMMGDGYLNFKKFKEGQRVYYDRTEIENYIANPPIRPRIKASKPHHNNPKFKPVVSCHLSNEQYNKLTQVSINRGTPMAVLMREAILQYLEG